MNKKSSALVVFFSAFILVVGCLLSIFHYVLHAPEYISAYLTKVEHPIQANYSEYDKFLKEVVKNDRVDYARAKSSKQLDKALDQFAKLSCDEFENDSEKLIYWVNAYNLLVIKTIADHFPIPSVKEVTNDNSSHRYTIGGEPITVRDVLQLRIQPLLHGSKNGDATDARMIMLIAGGAVGYPVICDHAIVSQGLKRDLEDNTYKFIHRPTNVFLGKEPPVLLISPYFQWNEIILEQSFIDPWDFVIYYMDINEKPDTSSFHFRQNYMTKFDWRINDTETKD